MAADLSRFTRHGKRTTVRDDRAQSIPTGLHDDVGMVPGDKARAESHGEVRESTLDVGLLVLAHLSIDEDLWTKVGEKSFDVADIHGNGTVIAEGFLDSRKIVGAYGMHALEDCGAVDTASAKAMPRLVVVGVGPSWMTTAYPSTNSRCATADPTSPTPRTTTVSAMDSLYLGVGSAFL
jgi:hypothetical protein